MLNEVIQNKAQAETQREAGIEVYPCEELLGSMKKVKDFAAFYANHKSELEVVKLSLLLDYCNTQSFTPTELKAFRMGLDMIQTFFSNAEADVKSYLLQAENKGKKSSG